MRTRLTAKTLTTVAVLCLMLLTTALAYAQEAEPAAQQEFTGGGTLILLMGIGAIGLITLVVTLRERRATDEPEV